jgi:hypothetical protein
MVRAFAHVGVTLGFKGKGVNEIGFVLQVDNDFEDSVIKARGRGGLH